MKGREEIKIDNAQQCQRISGMRCVEGEEKLPERTTEPTVTRRDDYGLPRMMA